MNAGKGFDDRYLTREEINAVVKEGLASLAVDGKRVLVIIPDGTRTMPMPLMYDLLEAHLAPRVAKLDYLVALGTHPLMDDSHLSKLVGRTVTNGGCGKRSSRYSMMTRESYSTRSRSTSVGTLL